MFCEPLFVLKLMEFFSLTLPALVLHLLLHVLHYKLKLDSHFEKGACYFVKRFSYGILDSAEN